MMSQVDIRNALVEFDAVARPFEKLFELKAAMEKHLKDSDNLKNIESQLAAASADLASESDMLASVSTQLTEKLALLNSAEIMLEKVTLDAESAASKVIREADDYAKLKHEGAQASANGIISEAHAKAAEIRLLADNSHREMESVNTAIADKKRELASLSEDLEKLEKKMAAIQNALDAANKA